MARTPTVVAIHRRLLALANAADAKAALWYFKTGPGDYGEGDRFLGIRAPVMRALVREFVSVPLDSISRLLESPWHEERLLAVLILVRQYDRGSEAERAAVFRLYMSSLDRVNNWDIVDSSAPRIVGRHLAGKGRGTLTRLARSEHLWSRRVAVLATAWDIGQGDFRATLAISKVLLTDDHDLIHKAVGWMLREVGKRDRAVMEAFLTKHAATMPRTMLRYAIEKLPTEDRRWYLKKAPAKRAP